MPKISGTIDDKNASMIDICTNLEKLSKYNDVFTKINHFKAITIGMYRNQHRLIIYDYNCQYFRLILKLDVPYFLEIS